ncbi:hypothetical protein MA03_00615 [Infirmifilum uzonense]|uniref:polynucleotide 5'-hydroxyl-kinase n=1 Tax=Infirmifilum uzonense TaxID=1550241 RepID=A0A0F7CKQ9_9CREN|nr:Clp1/GlmU family protein [Infirmifilum uzonense]AKG38091.1 hypothetical protein MA03_00615 [Infirmifilum uzonense]
MGLGLPEIKIPEGYTLIVYGPAKLKVLEGVLRVFGAEFSDGQEFNVEPTRALPLYAHQNAVINVEYGSFTFHIGDTTPGEWYELAEKLASSNIRRVLVIGDVDSGKTSLVTLLVNVLANRGNKVAVIDADVGQKSIGPPGTIGLGVTEKSVYSLSSIPLYDAFFTGSNSPASVIHRSIVGAALLARKAEKLVDRLIIDSTGWVTEGEGRELKFFKTLITEPDLVVLVGAPSQLVQIERELEALVEIVRVPKPAFIASRDKQDRKEYRRYMYSRYFTGASVKSISLNNIRTAYSYFLSGRPLDSEETFKLQSILGVEVLYAEKADDYLGAIVGSSPIPQALDFAKNAFSVRHFRLLQGYELLHSVVGFMSKERYCEGIGIITGFNAREKRVSVLTPVERIDNRLWLIGSQKVNPLSFEEEAGLEKWSL